MADDRTLQIVSRCLEIDETACRAYEELAATSANAELSEFWQAMSREEREHISFWRRLQEQTSFAGAPQVFEDGEAIASELAQLVPKAQALLARCRETATISDAFLLAYRLEFYLLHSAFETLFHFCRQLLAEPCPEDTYENHIDRFINTLAEHGEVSLELELLGETLQRLWRENRKLAERATRDPLTGLLNRRAFWEIARHLACLAQRRYSTVGVMMLDLDDFKKVNDTRGHVIGDEVLKGAAKVIRDALRGADVVGRYGGEEFAVFMPEAKPIEATAVAERIRTSVASVLSGDEAVTLSIGLVTGPIGTDVDAALQQLTIEADALLYEAKRQGKNRVVTGRHDEPR